jgi:hypothetical protein
MPVFNGEAFLAEAVESILGQSLSDLELIAVDDASTDSSPAQLAVFARRDERVRIITSTENVGIAGALNLGCQAARAVYIARLDADDIALEHRLERQTEFLDAHPSIAAVGSSAIMIDAQGRKGAQLRFPTSSSAIRKTLVRHNCIAHPTVVLRRDAFDEIGGYRFQSNEDYDLWLRLSERYALANLDEPLILYRRHTGQVSMNTFFERERTRLAIREAARARAGGDPDPFLGTDTLTPAVLARTEIDELELKRAVEREMLTWAATLSTLGDVSGAAAVVGEASLVIGPRARRAFEAAKELKTADVLRGEGRRRAAIAHVALGLAREPRYASRRLAEWLGDRF